MPDFKAKMHQIRFRLGSAPDPAGELTALPHSPDPLAGLRGPTSKGRGGGGGKVGRGGEGRREGEGRPPNVDALTPLLVILSRKYENWPPGMDMRIIMAVH